MIIRQFTYVTFLIFIISQLSCKTDLKEENRDAGSAKKNYNLDLESSEQINFKGFLDSVRVTKVLSEEPILLNSFAGHILKASKNYLFLKPYSVKAIYCLDRITYRILWVLNLKNNDPNFPQSLFDYALRQENDELYIWDYHKSLFYVYNFDGHHVRNVIPENLPNRHYFDFYNSLLNDGIIFRLQGVPDENDVYSDDYENKVFLFYSFSNNRFSETITLPEGSPKRNAMMSRYFYTGLGGHLYYFYYLGSDLYSFAPGVIHPFIDFRGSLFPDTVELEKVDQMNRIKYFSKDEEFIRELHRNKITKLYSVIEQENYYAIIINKGSELVYFLLSKHNSSFKYCKTEFDGFERLDGYGCFKKRPLYQMTDGRVYSITDGYFLNDSGLECGNAKINNHNMGDTISNEDLFITEYFFKNKIDFDDKIN